MRVVPQTLVYGGVLLYLSPQFEAIIKAMVEFQAKNKDPKAQIFGFFILAYGRFTLSLSVFYDAPTAPANIFDGFLNISHFSTLKTQTFLSFIQEPAVSRLATIR